MNKNYVNRWFDESELSQLSANTTFRKLEEFVMRQASQQDLNGNQEIVVRKAFMEKGKRAVFDLVNELIEIQLREDQDFQPEFEALEEESTYLQ